MNRKVGKVDWGSPALNTNNGEGEETKKIPFLTMKGNNKSWKVRVVSENPLRYWCHFTTDKSGKTVKVNCTLDDSCPVYVEKTKTPCAGTQADARYYLKVIDREDGTIKVLDVGKQIVNAIGEYIADPDWGHCSGYDITINKGAKGAMPLYTVNASPNKGDLTDEEKQLVANSEDPDHDDFIDLESRIQPLTGEVVGKILGLVETTSSKPKTATAAVTTSQALEDDDEEFDVSWDDDDE